MPTEPSEQLPDDPMPEVPLTELIERARAVGHPATLMDTRGRLISALRAREIPWRVIEAQTGIPQANARRWLKKYQEKHQQ